jgi:small conductance mechanosensitive channel
VVLLVRCFTKAADFWDTKLDLTRAIKERLDHEGISIPFPQRDIHLQREKAA